MRRIIKFALSLCLIMLFSLTLSACKDNNQETSKVKIGDVEYQTLSEAVQNAKSGDTIKVYEDLNDNKNIIIDKPLTIEGVLKEGQIKPKVYASITIDTTGQSDSTQIKNIELIHQGVDADGENNNTSIGLNLIDGGLTLKSNAIKLDKTASPSETAIGVVISRKINSKNIMPIIIEGNSFGTYKTNNQDLSGALIIKSNSSDTYQKIVLNEEEILSKNTFSSNEEGNQLISISYSSSPALYNYFVTSSMKNLITALSENQPTTYATFTLYPTSSIEETASSPIVVKEHTVLIIDGTNPADFQDSQINVEGALVVNGNIQNVKIKRILPTSYVNLGKNANLNKIELL